MTELPYYKIPFSAPLHIGKMSPSSFRLIIIGVFLIHLFGIWVMTIPFSAPPKMEARQKVVVKTIKLNPHKLQPPDSVSHATTVEPIPVVPTPLPEPIAEIKKEQPIAQLEPEETPPPAPLTPAKPKVTPKPPQVKPKKVETKPIPPPKAKPKTLTKPITPKKHTETKKPVAPVKSPTPPKPKPKVEPKKETPQETAAKEAEKARLKEIAEAQEIAQKKQQALLAKAKANLAKVGETRNKMGDLQIARIDTTAIPRQLENLQIDALPVGTSVPTELNSKEISYRDEVAYRLKLALKLPDYGAVKIKLTLNRSGSVSAVQTISSESSKNKQYIERTVPSLTFPAFGNNFTGASQYTFLISLNND